MNWHYGAVRLESGETRFRLWAPAQETISVAFKDGPLLPMARLADGWFEATARCAHGRRYRYRLADGMLVPDPASRAQANDVHDPSLVVDIIVWSCTDSGVILSGAAVQAERRISRLRRVSMEIPRPAGENAGTSG